jgi:hypothetical protein
MIDTILLALQWGAAVGVLACLISESILFMKVREILNHVLFECPICLGFWIAIPCLVKGPLFYLLVVGMSNVWMLIILKVYETLDAGASESDD